MTPRKIALLILALALLVQRGAIAGEIDILAPTKNGPVAVKMFAASGDEPRPAVLVLHGRSGIAPFSSAYARYATALAAAGIDAWLFSYYTADDAAVMTGTGEVRRASLYTARFNAWVATIDDIAHFARTQKGNSGRAGLLGFSQGGFLAVGAAAKDARIGALVVLYGALPEPMRDEITRLPPLLALHGDADLNVPIAEGRELVERARALGGQAELIAYAGAGHGFDFDEGNRAAIDARARAVSFLRHHLIEQ